MEGEGDRKRKMPMEPELENLLRSGNKGGPEPCRPVLVVTTEIEEKPKTSAAVDREREVSPSEQFAGISDKDLSITVARMKSLLSSPMSANLPDRGEKLRASISRHEAELQHRKFVKDQEICKKPTQSVEDPTCVDVPDVNGPSAPSSVPSSLSIFSSHFCSKLDGKACQWTTKASEKEVSTLNHCGRKNTRVDKQFLAPEIQKGGLCSRQIPSQSPNHLSEKVVEQSVSNNEQKGKSSPFPSPHQCGEDLPECFAKKRSASCVEPSHDLRHINRKTFVLVDEEETDTLGKTQANTVAECIKETRIYYPSRDDPESIEICDSDVDCLVPESFLSSTIMNFYIWYLQKSTPPTDTERHAYHFFNTYFYEKLKVDVLAKNDKETSFVKFRRWWKGVNIFEKAYIFLPIHENLHWSLVIICIPDKEDGSGPILLHLDSLRLHSSKSIFENIRSFLIEEWKFLRREEAETQLSIADNVWKKLSRRIDKRIIKVPQQKNEYDCGLFVLFFMERFLEDAPERLKKKDLAMFGKQWFKPEEASSLRQKIRDLLEEFKNANKSTPVSNP